MRKVLLIFLFSAFIISCKKSHTISKPNSLIAETALRYKGVPYKYGGNTHAGMDCSGLLFRAFSDVGKSFMRSSYEQAEVYPTVSKSKIEVGDLVYFKIGKTSRINHTGIVTKIVSRDVILFLHSSSSAGVREDNLYSNYWKPKFVKVTRPSI